MMHTTLRLSWITWCLCLLPVANFLSITSQAYVRMEDRSVDQGSVDHVTMFLGNGSTRTCGMKCSLLNSTGFLYNYTSQQCHCYTSCIALDYNLVDDAGYDVYLPAEYQLSQYCHKLILTPHSWIHVQVVCDAFDMELADIEDEMEDTHITHMLTDLGIDADVWFGLNDSSEETVFESYREAEEPTYTNWNANEPQSQGPYGNNVQNCVRLMRNDSWKWADTDCHQQLYALCESTYDFY